MKLRAFFGRYLPERARVSLIALGLVAVLLIAGFAAAPEELRQWLRGEDEEGLAQVNAPITAEENWPDSNGLNIPGPDPDGADSADPNGENELVPALAEQDNHLDEEESTEDGQSPEHSPNIDLSRLINDNPAIIRPYGYDYNPNTEDYRFHRGSDLAATSGQPIFAPASGVVRQAEEDSYWGGVLIIDHDGWTSILRCVTPRVEEGQKVLAGDFIASVAAAPAEAAQESHFHVEAESDGQSVDPALYF